ncbi:hypothetical protein RZS08_59115, partial [Arthrospira platensis SPKY1]|nr:hypothetical protein [Arthrospira platensis SPKY1]
LEIAPNPDLGLGGGGDLCHRPAADPVAREDHARRSAPTGFGRAANGRADVGTAGFEGGIFQPAGLDAQTTGGNQPRIVRARHHIGRLLVANTGAKQCIDAGKEDVL